MSALYDSDYLAWTEQQTDALRRRSANEIDWDNLLEEVGDLGRSVQRELDNRLRVLLGHLLKWRRQPDLRTRSWVFTVHEQRRSIEKLISLNPSLRPRIEDAIRDAWPLAVLDAAYETGFHPNDFPHAPTLDFEQAMTSEIRLDDEPQRRSRTRKTKS